MIIWQAHKSEHIGWCVCAYEGGYRSRSEAPILATDAAHALEIERRENRLESLIDYEKESMKTTKVIIHFTPANVRVSDERGTVPGARVELDYIGTDIARGGVVIPPEGDSIDCWCDVRGATFSLPGEIVDALRDAARQGARGKNGSLTVEITP